MKLSVRGATEGSFASSAYRSPANGPTSREEGGCDTGGIHLLQLCSAKEEMQMRGGFEASCFVPTCHGHADTLGHGGGRTAKEKLSG